jgi:hypothetical protein
MAKVEEDAIRELKSKLMNLQEDLEMADRLLRAAQGRTFRYNDIWRKQIAGYIEVAMAELDMAIREYQRIFENNKE